MSDPIAVDLGEIRRPSDLLQDPAISTAATVRARAPGRWRAGAATGRCSRCRLFASVDEGSATKRVVLGFGSGGAELKTIAKGFLMTEQGLRALGSGEVAAGSGKLPGGAIPLAVTIATANPIGLIVSGGVKAYGEMSGSETIEGAARRTADEIASKIRITAEKQGWI